jgi:hypothetical protein
MVGVPVVFYRATRAHWLGREDGAAPELHSLSFVFLFFLFLYPLSGISSLPLAYKREGLAPFGRRLFGKLSSARTHTLTSSQVPSTIRRTERSWAHVTRTPET